MYSVVNCLTIKPQQNYIIFLLFQGELTQDQVEKLKEHHRECSQISGVSQDLVKKARQGDFSEDQKLKNHLFCVSKKIGFQSEDGKIQNEVLKTKVGAALGDQELANSLIGECAKESTSGPETAFQIIKCYYEKTPKHISIV